MHLEITGKPQGCIMALEPTWNLHGTSFVVGLSTETKREGHTQELFGVIN